MTHAPNKRNARSMNEQRVNVSIPAPLWDRVRALAAENRRSGAQQLVVMLEDAISRAQDGATAVYGVFTPTSMPPDRQAPVRASWPKERA